MSNELTIQILYSIICFLEAWLEVIVIKLKNPFMANYAKLNNQEHSRSTVYAVTVGMALIIATMLQNGFDYKMIIVLVLMLFIRRIWFDAPLKRMRNIKIRVNDGKGTVDKAFRSLFGKNGGWKELIACILLVTIVNFFLWKFKN